MYCTPQKVGRGWQLLHFSFIYICKLKKNVSCGGGGCLTLIPHSLILRACLVMNEAEAKVIFT